MKSQEQSRSPSREGTSILKKLRSRSPKDSPTLANAGANRMNSQLQLNSPKSAGKNFPTAGSEFKFGAQAPPILVERSQSPAEATRGPQDQLKNARGLDDSPEIRNKGKVKKVTIKPKDYLETAIDKVRPILDKYQGLPIENLDCGKINKHVAKLGKRILTPQGAGLSKIINKTKIQKSLKIIEKLNEIEVRKLKNAMHDNEDPAKAKNELIKKDFDYNMDNPLIDDNTEQKEETIFTQTGGFSNKRKISDSKKRKVVKKGFYNTNVRQFMAPGFIREDSKEVDWNSTSGKRSPAISRAQSPNLHGKSFSPNERGRVKYVENVKTILDNCKGVQSEFGDRQKRYIDVLSRETQDALTKLLNKMNKVNCETDFVARTELFTTFVDALVKTASALPEPLRLAETKNQESLEKMIEEFSLKSIMSEAVFPDQSKVSISETKQLVISKLQENIKIRRLMTLKEEPNTIHGIYVHNTLRNNIGSTACVLTLACKTAQVEKLQELANNMAMQILGTKPQYLELKDVPSEILREESEKIKKELGHSLSGKPENVVQKIIEGKLKRFYQDSVLYLMDYILAPEGEELSVQDYLKKQEKDLGDKVQLRSFSNWQLGSD